MKKRIITAIFVLLIFVPTLIFSGSPALPIIMAICSIFSVYELFACVGYQKSIALSLPFYLIAAGFPFLVRYCKDLAFLMKLTVALSILFVLYGFAVVIFTHGKYTVENMAMIEVGCFYALVGFNAMMVMRDYFPGGAYLLPIVFIAAWVTDVFALFCGLLFGRGGKHKLIPEISPKKTVEGSIGGIIFCMVAVVLYGFLIGKFVPQVAFATKPWIALLLGLFLSVVSQIGDLLMSLVKRHYGIKDFGKIFPGHGGMLDRFDSVIAVSAALFVFCTFFKFFEVG
ncbi:MAG: phosphatidate cytidylyltransferase [Clostridia bacterium]|nr:phosphatidate cytidylyltransferase [Clostridia bacterium]